MQDMEKFPINDAENGLYQIAKQICDDGVSKIFARSFHYFIWEFSGASAISPSDAIKITKRILGVKNGNDELSNISSVSDSISGVESSTSFQDKIPALERRSVVIETGQHSALGQS